MHVTKKRRAHARTCAHTHIYNVDKTRGKEKESEEEGGESIGRAAKGAESGTERGRNEVEKSDVSYE